MRNFILSNFTPFQGDASFLETASPRTERLWAKLETLFREERIRGVLSVSQVPSSITAHTPGYIDPALELIVGLQTGAPLERAVFPNGVVVGNAATAAELAHCKEAVLANPRNFVAQPIVLVSTAPTLCDGAVEPRHLDLRPFILRETSRSSWPRLRPRRAPKNEPSSTRKCW